MASTSLPQGDRRWLRVLVGLIALLLLAHLVFAASVRLDYYDTYENLLNARTVAGLEPPYYHALRPPLPALMFAPLFMLEYVGATLATILTLTHLLAVLVGIGTILSVYWLLRAGLPVALASFGAIVVALSPVLNHYLPMARDDIPAMLLLTLGFAFYLRLDVEARWWRWLVCGVLFGLAMAMRYNLAPLIPAVVVLHQLLSGAFRVRLFHKILYLLVIPLLVLLLIPCITFPLAGHSTVTGAVAQFITDFRIAAADQARFAHEPGWYAYGFLADSVTWPVLLLSLAGIVIAVRRREAHWLLMLLWLGVFLLFHAHAVSIKEARYLFVVFPPVAYFAAVAFGGVWRAVGSLPVAGANRALLILLVLAWPLYGTVRTFVRFSDDVYHVRFEQEAAGLAFTIAGDRTVWWVGSYYPIYPRDFRVLPRDKFTAIYHFAPHVVQLLSGRVPQVVDAPPVPPGAPYDPTRELQRLAMLAPQLADGDVLMISPDPFVTAPVAPATPRPLIILRVGIVTGGRTISVGAGQLLLRQERDGLVVEGSNLPPGPGVIQLMGANGATQLVAGVTPESGQITRRLTGPQVPPLDAVYQVRYAYPAELQVLGLPGRIRP